MCMHLWTNQNCTKFRVWTETIQDVTSVPTLWTFSQARTYPFLPLFCLVKINIISALTFSPKLRNYLPPLRGYPTACPTSKVDEQWNISAAAIIVVFPKLISCLSTTTRSCTSLDYVVDLASSLSDETFISTFNINPLTFHNFQKILSLPISGYPAPWPSLIYIGF